MFYPIDGEQYTLLPLSDQANFQNLVQLCNKKDFQVSSQIRGDELNFFDSYTMFESLVYDWRYWANNRLYLVSAKEGHNFKSANIGIIGLRNMDFIQRRAELVLVTDQESVRQKMTYEPLKLLLNHAIRVLRFRRLWMRVMGNDTQTMTILKGFGFAVEGKFREELIIGDELIDVNILGLLSKEYHVLGNE